MDMLISVLGYIFSAGAPSGSENTFGEDCTGDAVVSLCLMGCPCLLMPFCIEWVYNLKQIYGVIFRGSVGDATNQKVLKFSKGASKLSESRRACEGYTCCWLGNPWWLKFYLSPCVFPLGIFILWSLLYLAMYCKHTPVVLSHRVYFAAGGAQLTMLAVGSWLKVKTKPQSTKSPQKPWGILPISSCVLPALEACSLPPSHGTGQMHLRPMLSSASLLQSGSHSALLPQVLTCQEKEVVQISLS